jgi:hypothetical protein
MPVNIEACKDYRKTLIKLKAFKSYQITVFGIA